jgi:exonuclease III
MYKNMKNLVCQLKVIDGVRKIASVFLILFFLLSCTDGTKNHPGVALVQLDFYQTIENKGLAGIDQLTSKAYSFAGGVLDSALNLSANTTERWPLVLALSGEQSLNEYEGYTVEVWARKSMGDNQQYVVAGCKSETQDGFLGWEVGAAAEGSWSWKFSNGSQVWSYSPTVERYDLSDGKWHQLVFSIDIIRQEARLYFDGQNAAVYSLHGVDSISPDEPIYLGADPLASDYQMETFNGYIDEFRIWSRPLQDNEVLSRYQQVTGKWSSKPAKAKEDLLVMAWNIWHGGRHQGKEVGVQRVVEIIKNSGADVVLMQETYGSGEKIADALGYYYFYRSSNLSVMSRYPFLESYDSFKPFNFGCVNIDLGNGKQVLFCPIWLHYLPNTGAYVKTGKAMPDTIVHREWQTRGREMRFILGELAAFDQGQKRNLVVGGDFNSGSHLDWTDRNKENYYGLVVEYPVSMQMQEAGFTDTYRSIYPDETTHLGRTWSPVFKSDMQDRIDYIYYKGEALEPIGSQVIEDHSLGFPSDHAAVITHFRLK